MDWWWPAAGLGALSVAVHAWDVLKEVAINPTIELPELTQEWEIDSGRAQRNLVCTRTQEKGAVTPQETVRDLPVDVWESQVECGSVAACCTVGDTECSSSCMGSFEGGHHYLHYLHHSLKFKKFSHSVVSDSLQPHEL